MCVVHVYIGVAAEDCSLAIAICRLVLVIVASTKLQQFERPAEPDRAPAQSNHRRETTYHDESEDICLVSRELRSDEHTSELQSLMRNSYAVFCLKTKQ